MTIMAVAVTRDASSAPLTSRSSVAAFLSELIYKRITAIILHCDKPAPSAPALQVSAAHEQLSLIPSFHSPSFSAASDNHQLALLPVSPRCWNKCKPLISVRHTTHTPIWSPQLPASLVAYFPGSSQQQHTQLQHQPSHQPPHEQSSYNLGRSHVGYKGNRGQENRSNY